MEDILIFSEITVSTSIHNKTTYLKILTKTTNKCHVNDSNKRN